MQKAAPVPLAQGFHGAPAMLRDPALLQELRLFSRQPMGSLDAIEQPQMVSRLDIARVPSRRVMQAVP